MKNLLLLSAVLLATSISNTALSAIIQDGDFTAWSSFSFVVDDLYVAGSPPNVSSGSTSTVSTGGNPGAFLQADHTVTYGDTIWTGGIKTDATYSDPYTAINSISVSADLLSTLGATTAWSLVVEQGGQRYYSFPNGVFSNTSWSSITATNLVATDFDTSPWSSNTGYIPDGNHPDFRSAAAPLQFGFMFGNRVINPGTLPNTLGLDNFMVEINPVPVPAAIWLFGSGLAGLIGFARTKNRK